MECLCSHWLHTGSTFQLRNGYEITCYKILKIYRSEIVTVPKKSVDYSEFAKQGFGKGKIEIRCPDGSTLNGFMYDGIAGYGQYYQLRAYGDPNNALKQFKVDEEIIVKLYKNNNGYFADLVKIAEILVYTTMKEEADEALFEGALTKVPINRYERNAKARRLCIDHYGSPVLYANYPLKIVTVILAEIIFTSII